MLNTLPTHPQTHFQQLSSLTQRQQRPANNQKSKKSKKQLPQGIHKGKQANSQKGHFAEAKQRTRRSQKHATRDKTSFHTLYKPWKTFVHIQSISNEVWKHAKFWKTRFPTVKLTACNRPIQKSKTLESYCAKTKKDDAISFCMGTNVFQGFNNVWRKGLSGLAWSWDLCVRCFASAKWPRGLFACFSFVKAVFLDVFQKKQ